MIGRNLRGFVEPHSSLGMLPERRPEQLPACDELPTAR
jgi:hypothetical protein